MSKKRKLRKPLTNVFTVQLIYAGENGAAPDIGEQWIFDEKDHHLAIEKAIELIFKVEPGNNVDEDHFDYFDYYVDKDKKWRVAIYYLV